MKKNNENETELSEIKLNLYEKIQAVSNEVRNITKDMTVGTGTYQYKAVSDIAVTLAIKDAETKFKLISIPIKQELLNHEVLKTISKDGKEGFSFIDNIKMTVRIVDIEDTTQFVEIESFGKGVDSGDKGFGKASTYARKYALLNAYKIATGEDPDAEKNKEIEGQKTPDEKLVSLKNYFDKNIGQLQHTLQHFNVGTIDDLSAEQIKTIHASYSAKNLL